MSSGIVHVTNTGQFNLDRAVKLLAGIGGYGGNGSAMYRAVYAALKRSGESAKTQAGRFAAEQYTISKGRFMSHVREKIHLKGSSGGLASVNITFAGSVIPLIEFRTSFSKTGGVYASVKKSGGGTLSHAFVANIGGLNVYERVSKKRFPIQKKYGPSAAHMMMNENVVEDMDKHITKVFNDRIEHEITRILNGW